MMRSIGLIVLIVAALAPGAAVLGQDVPRVVERRPRSAPAPRSEALLRAAVLEAHNQERAALGIAPLVWDEALVASARGYAEELAKTGRFAHSIRPHGPGREGENLWRGSRRAYRYQEMLGHWLAERSNFVNAPTPNFSRTGRYQDVTHYAQIVWRATTRVGCAMAAGPADENLVCRYSPSANVVGQRPY